jgi:hypothetical protein
MEVGDRGFATKERRGVRIPVFGERHPPQLAVGPGSRLKAEGRRILSVLLVTRQRVPATRRKHAAGDEHRDHGKEPPHRLVGRW